jgi:MFS family permease
MAKQSKQKTSGLTKNTFLLALTSMFADISTEMLYPILPIFLTQNLHASGAIIGLIEGIAETAQNSIQGFSGWLSDKLQKRKGIAIFGYALQAVSKPIIGYATGWPLVLAARFSDRAGAATRSAPRDALVAGSADEKNRGKAFGLEGLGDNMGAFLGPIITVILIFFLSVDIRTIFFLAAIPAALAVFMIFQVKERPVSIESKSKIDTSFRRFPKGYWQFLATIGVFGIGNSSNAFLILQTRDLGVSLEGTILIYAALNLVAALISYPSGWLSDKLGRKTVLLASLVIFMVTYATFGFTSNLWLIGILFVMYGFYQGIFRAVGKAMASDYVPASLHASSIGWFNTVIGLTGLAASIIAGQLWDNFGHQSTFIYGAFFAALGILALIFIKPPQKGK